jgi:hypothetical protein
VVTTDTDGFDELAVPLDLLLTRCSAWPTGSLGGAGVTPTEPAPGSHVREPWHMSVQPW